MLDSGDDSFYYLDTRPRMVKSGLGRDVSQSSGGCGADRARFRLLADQRLASRERKCEVDHADQKTGPIFCQGQRRRLESGVRWQLSGSTSDVNGGRYSRDAAHSTCQFGHPDFSVTKSEES